jgi:hypothetical protein
MDKQCFLTGFIGIYVFQHATQKKKKTQLTYPGIPMLKVSNRKIKKQLKSPLELKMHNMSWLLGRDEVVK